MARRAANSPKTRQKTVEAPTFELLEPATKSSPRRKRAVKPREAEPVETTTEHALFSSDEVAVTAAEPQAEAPVKARRGRKPKAQPAPKASTELEHAKSAGSLADTALYGDEVEQPDMLADPAGPPPKSLPEVPHSPDLSTHVEPLANVNSDVSSSSADAPVVAWNPETGTATFAWLAIERVAAASGPNQAMARLLLAARADGANSRWPFS